MTPDFVDDDFPVNPYPGARPKHSFLHVDQSGYSITPSEVTSSGWSVHGEDLDELLRRYDAAPLSERLPVLAYGSNVNPSKITWLRQKLGLRGPAVVLQARCHDIAAVWSAGVRKRDDQRPAVLAGVPGTAEDHAIWLVTPDQRAILDECEGRGERYRLAWVHTPIQLEKDGTLQSVLAYTARPEVIGHDVVTHLNRSPLLINGNFVRCSEVGQDEARRLVGVPADSDRLNCTEVEGEP